MSLTFNGTDVKSASFNGTSLTRIYYQPKDGACTLVWQKKDLYTVRLSPAASVCEWSDCTSFSVGSSAGGADLFTSMSASSGCCVISALLWPTRYGCGWLIYDNTNAINTDCCFGPERAIDTTTGCWVEYTACVTGPETVYYKTDSEVSCMYITASRKFGDVALNNYAKANVFWPMSDNGALKLTTFNLTSGVTCDMDTKSDVMDNSYTMKLMICANVTNSNVTLCVKDKEFTYAFCDLLNGVEFYA